MSNVPPATRGKAGRMKPMTPEQKAKRAAKRSRKKTWAARVWMRRHIKGDI